MVTKLALLVISAIIASAAIGCKSVVDIPLDFPTPPPPPAATPAQKLTLKPDAALEKQFAEIAKDAKGKVGVAAVVLETGDAAFLNADQHFPMQSVYKLPIAMAVMEQVRLGELELDEKIGVTPEDFVRPGMASSLRDKNPNGGEFTIRELIRLALIESDGTASDVLMRVAGGAGEIQSYLTQIGIQNMKVVNTEKEIGRDWQTQYDNWSTPREALELLRGLSVIFGGDKAMLTTPDDQYLKIQMEPEANVDEPMIVDPTENQMLVEQSLFILSCMRSSIPGAKRLKSELPDGTIVAHKTGTGGTRNGVTSATNDIGIINLPNGKRIAITVFVSDSSADEKTREAVIAKIAKAAWDRWVK